MTDYYYFLFLIPYVLIPKERKVWGILFITSLIIVVNAHLFSNEHGSQLYINRAVITFASCFWLLKLGTLHAYYQSCIYIATLTLFLTLEIDVVFVQNIIYSEYEYYTHGIILIKFLGIALSIPIRDIIYNTDNNLNTSTDQRGQE